MVKEKMNIHKALSELKIIDDRIEANINMELFGIANKHSNKKINGDTIEEAEKMIVSQYDKTKSLIARRKAIKKAVVLSNAKTIVNIAGNDYTVAEAIELKNSGIGMERVLLERMENQYSSICAKLERENGDNLTDKAEKYVIGLYGSKDVKNSTDDFKKAMNDYMDNNKYDFIDPIGLKKEIEKLTERIDAFYSDIDSALSVSNAMTVIEVEY